MMPTSCFASVLHRNRPNLHSLRSCLAVLLMVFAASAGALSLTGVQSRKTHATAGVQDLAIDRTQSMSGPVTVEPRTIGTGHTIVFQFDAAITLAGVLSVIDDTITAVPGVSAVAVGNTVVVTIPALADNKRVTISLSNVNGVGLNVEVSMGFRVGDTDGTGTVTSADVSRVKSRAGQAAGATTFAYDLNASGTVSAADISATKTRVGVLTLPPGNAAPVVSAGTNQTITLPASANLAGTATDDGLPNPPATLTRTWSKFSGPGTVSFGNAAAASTTASFSSAGTYVLRLTASDSQRSASADVTITVNPDTAPAISGFAPASALVGQAVTINGSNFTGATVVRFNGTNQPVFTVVTASQITTTVPAGATSGAISVTTPFGVATSTSFTVIVPPTVTSTTPAGNATGVQPATAITVNFSEAVTAPAAAFTLECPVGTPRTFTLAPLSAAASFTLTPATALPAGTACRLTVLAAQVADVDTSQNMSANFVLNFTTGAPPAITSAASATFAPGKSGQTFTVSTTGSPTNTISRTGTLPAGVTFTDNGNNTATIAGTPAAGTQATSPYAWLISAGNGILPNASQNFTFNVTCPLITVSGAVPGLTVGNAMTPVSLSQSGGNGTATWSASGLPAGLALGSSTGQLTGTPTVTGTFSVNVSVTDAGGCTGNTVVSISVAPVATGDSYSGLVDNTQFVLTGGTTATPATPVVFIAGKITANDLPAGGVTATAGTFATSAGGSVTIAADGTFVYTPKANPGLAAITSDSFTYTITSNTGGGAAVTSAPGTVTLTLGGRVWYVKNDGAAGNGQSQSPFNTLAGAIAASVANDTIYVYQGNGTTTNLATASTLKTGQRLIGQGAALSVNANTLVAAGGFPLIGGTVTLASSVTVNGFDMSTGTANGIVGAGITGVSVTVRDLTSTAGTAVSLTGTGNTGTYSFRSISSNGGTNGILLQNNTGSFTVTGNSAGNCGGVVVNNITAPTAPVLADCTGGTIQNKATGIRLDNVQNVSLTRMRITGTSANNFGIYGTSVNGFTLARSVIDGSIGATTGGQDGPLVFGKSNPSGLNGLSGVNTITDSTISGGIEHNMEFYSQSGTASLTITRTVVISNSVAGGSDGIQMEMQGTASMTALVDNGYFNDNKSQAIQAAANDNSIINLTVRNSKWTRTTQGNEGALFSNGSNGQLTLNISGNIVSGFDGTSIFVGQTAGNATAASKLHATIQNNTVTAPVTATNHAIIGFMTSTIGAGAAARIRIANNSVTQNSTTGVARGILIDTPDASTNPNFQATVTGNNVVGTDTVNGVGVLVVQARQSSTACMAISGNTATAATGGVNAIRARQVAPAVGTLSGSGASAAAVLAANNPGSTTEVLGTITLTGATCALPDSPTLP